MISQHTSCRKVAYVIGGIYDVIEWSRGYSDYLADHSSIQILNRPTFFDCFIAKLLVMIEFLMRVFSLHAIVGCDHV